MTRTSGCSDEVERAYLRILSQNVLDIVKSGCQNKQTETTNLSGDSLDLSSTGREFVNEALAKKLLQPLLDPGVTARRALSQCSICHTGKF